MGKLAEIILEDARSVCKKVSLKNLYRKTILITGASGLLGVHFLACLKYALLESPGSIRIIAVMQSPPEPYLQEILSDPMITVLRGDITNVDFVRSLPEVDHIIHAAGYGQPGRFMEDPVKTLKINTVTTFELMEKLSSDGQFLFVSSAEVYSGLKTPPFSEEEIGQTNTTHIRSCYIEAKRCGEAICQAYRTRGRKAKAARLALAYGPGTRAGDKRVLNSFIERALHGGISLLDQGAARRTYCYVADAVEIMWKILMFGNEAIYNVGGVSRITIGELAQKIGVALNAPVAFPADVSQKVSGAPDDVYLDMSLVEREFQKKDYVPFEVGLTRTIEWQKALYSISDDVLQASRIK